MEPVAVRDTEEQKWAEHLCSPIPLPGSYKIPPSPDRTSPTEARTSFLALAEAPTQVFTGLGSQVTS